MKINFTKDKEFIGRMFDEISPVYDRMNHIMSGGQDLKWRRQAVSYVQSLGNHYRNILDLAAGSGDFGKEFLKLNPDVIYSADLSLEMLKINRSKINTNNSFQIKADAENLPFKNGFFDLCGISFGLRNFENIHVSLSEIGRVIKSNGLFIVIEMFKPMKPSLVNSAFKLYFNKLVPKVGNVMSRSKYAYNYLHKSVDNFIPVDSFINIVEKHGFITIGKKRNFSDIVYSVCFRKS